jgi:putative flippase GtrA
MNLLLRYGTFAIIAIMANIGSQILCLWIYAGMAAIPLSIAVGTGVGLVVKFVFDRLWIFQNSQRNAVHIVHTFWLYTLTGQATTLLFWVIEYGFHLFFASAAMRYLGGVLGLVLGYWLKYHLDARWVFGPRETQEEPATDSHHK